MVIAKQYQLLFKKVKRPALRSLKRLGHYENGWVTKGRHFVQDLIKELKADLSGKLEDVIIALMQPPELQDAHTLHGAIAVKNLQDNLRPTGM